MVARPWSSPAALQIAREAARRRRADLHFPVTPADLQADGTQMFRIGESGPERHSSILSLPAPDADGDLWQLPAGTFKPVSYAGNVPNPDYTGRVTYTGNEPTAAEYAYARKTFKPSGDEAHDAKELRRAAGRARIEMQLDGAGTPDPVPVLPKNRMAGMKAINFFTSPLGEEVIEGALGGTMVVAPQFFSEEDPRENALQLALAIGGGIGVGMAGRRIGAALGKKLHKDPIENEFANAIGGTMGQERMSQGLTHAMSQMSAMNTIGGLQTAGLRLRSDLGAMTDDAFAAAYPDLAKAGLLPSSITPQQIEALSAFEQQLGRGVRENIQQQAAEMGEFATKFKSAAADESLDLSGDQRELAAKMGELTEGLEGALMGKKEPVTGEHVGRAVGRFLGDEIGILGGAGIGALIAQGLGWQSSKDLEIARLNEELAKLT